jgi:hypothetical protein
MSIRVCYNWQNSKKLFFIRTETTDLFIIAGEVNRIKMQSGISQINCSGGLESNHASTSCFAPQSQPAGLYPKVPF